MVDPDYDSMEDYVDVESLNAYQSLLAEGQSPEEAFRISRLNLVIILGRLCSGMIWSMPGFTTGTPWLKAGKSILLSMWKMKSRDRSLAFIRN